MLIKYDDFINEGYRDVDEINMLADEVIKYISRLNYPLVNNILDGYRGNNLPKNTMYLSRINHNQFPRLGNFIRIGRTMVQFTDDILEGGGYNNNIITIKISKAFIHVIINLMKANKNLRRKDGFSDNDAYTIMKLAINTTYKDIIVHELKHAFDDFRSSGKYQHGKYQQQYNIKYSDKTSIETDEQRMAYLKCEPEYWARFVVVINRLPLNKTKSELFEYFQNNLEGYWDIPEKNRKRLDKAFYKYCDEYYK